jgi:uncharacterized membrane protein (UPF0127 family)
MTASQPRPPQLIMVTPLILAVLGFFVVIYILYLTILNQTISNIFYISPLILVVILGGLVILPVTPNKFMPYIWVAFIVSIIFFAFASSDLTNNLNTDIPVNIEFSKITVTLPNNQNLTLDIAETPAEAAYGISFRKDLPENTGMLTTISEDIVPIYKTQNLRTQVEVLALAEDGRIIEIFNAQPCYWLPCPMVTLPNETYYVIEFGKGTIEQHNLKQHDIVNINLEE